MPEPDIFDHLHLVPKIARKLRRKLPRWVETGDLVSDGFIGLLRAARRFDPGHAIPFPRFACVYIRGAMIDGLRAFDWVPRRARAQGLVIRTMHPLASEPPGPIEPDPPSDRRDLVARALAQLPRRARLILQLYYLEQLSMEQVGQVMRLSESRISQLHRTIQNLSLRADCFGSPP